MACIKIRHRESNGYTGGKYHDENALRDVIGYITDPSKTSASLIGGIGVNPYNAIYEMEALSTAYAQDHGVRLRHFILSFQEGELYRNQARGAEMAYRLAYQIAQYYGFQYQIIYAVHLNTKRVHVHFCMSTTNYLTGLKYPGKKQDLYQFLGWARDVLEPYNIKVQFLKDDGDWEWQCPPEP